MKNNEKASGKTPPPSSNAAAGGSSPPLADAAKPPSEEQVQKEMFSSFAKGLDPEVQERLSTWLPDVLNGGKKDLKEAAQGLSARQAADLNALAKSWDIDAEATEATPVKNEGKGLFKGIAAAIVEKANIEPLQQLQQAYGEHSLKESTPGLAPTTSYDTGKMPKAADSAVYANFTKGLDEATKQQLLTWLPAALDDPSKAPKDPNGPQSDALAKLAKLHGLEKKEARLEGVMTEYRRDRALATAGELPTVVDMMLVQHDGKDEGDTAAEIKVKGDDINARVAKYEQEGFGALDSWLPAALAGQGEIPKGDAEAMALLNRFATNMGFEGGPDATAEEAFAYLDKSGAIEKALHPSRTGKDNSFLLFSDTFLDSTLKYGAKNGALSQEMMADTASVAEMLLGPDDGSNAPREVDTQALMAAVLHRTDQPLERQQELMAAAGYINKAESLGEQKARLANTVMAFHVREKIGTPPMTARQWGESYAEVHPDLYDQVNERAFNSPIGGKMQIITAHLGVPGDHKFMIDGKRKIKMSNDDLGNVESFDLKKKKTKWYKSVIDIAIPVVATVLTFTGWGTAAGIALNTAYSAYKGAQAIKNGDLLGGALAIAGGVTGGAASYLGSAATVATTAARGVAVANGALNGYRAAKSGDILGVVTSGLGAAAGGGAGRGFQTAATGINAGRAIESGDYLAAGAGVASLAGDAATYSGADGAQYAFQGVEQGLSLAGAIDDKNYAGIGSAASGLLQTGHDYHDYRDDKAKQERANAAAKNAPTTDENGNKVILRAGHQNGERGITVEGGETPTTNNIEVAGGDTLSQIAARHGTTVDALMAANPGISDPNRIFAGQQLSLPRGVQPIGTGQQDRLAEFAEMQGGGTQFLPSPPRPGEGNPTLQPGATHPNAGGQAGRLNDGENQLGELAEGAGRILAAEPAEIRAEAMAMLDIVEVAVDGIAAAAHTLDGPNQAKLQDAYDRTQERLAKFGDAIEHLEETAPDLPKHILDWAKDTYADLEQGVQTLGGHIEDGNGVEVGASIMSGILAVVGGVRGTVRDIADILRPMGPADRPGGGGSDGTSNSSITIPGKLTGIADNLTSSERSFADLELAKGRNVDLVPTGNDRTPDFVINGVRTELKTISGVRKTTNDGISSAMASRTMDARGQAGAVVLDMRGQDGITQQIAERGIGRAFGADNKSGGKIEQIRVVGPDFDIIVQRK